MNKCLKLGVPKATLNVGLWVKSALRLCHDKRTLYVVDRSKGTIHALAAVTLEEQARGTMRAEAVCVVTQ